MNSCMISYATQGEQDAAREEWLTTQHVRVRQREEKAKQRREQEKFHREWWGLPPLSDEDEEGKSQGGKR